MARSHGCNANGQPYGSMYVAHLNVDWASTEPTKTRTEFQDECDINVLMSRYEKNGTLPPVNSATPNYLDVSDVPDLAQAFDIVEQASKAFFTLSAAVRREFDNDPVAFATYATDPKNLDKMREWGLAPPAPVEPPPQKVEIVQGASPPPSPAAPAA